MVELGFDSTLVWENQGEGINHAKSQEEVPKAKTNALSRENGEEARNKLKSCLGLIYFRACLL